MRRIERLAPPTRERLGHLEALVDPSGYVANGFYGQTRVPRHLPVAHAARGQL
jgi:hypothetical protein